MANDDILKELILRVSADISQMRFVERCTQEIHHSDGNNLVNVDPAARWRNVWVVDDNVVDNLLQIGKVGLENAD